MAEIELELSDRIDQDIDRFVQQGDFLDRENAIEELLAQGISVYEETSDAGATTEPGEDVFTSAIDEQQDPAMRDDPGDEYGF